jgi:hypothetical protein
MIDQTNRRWESKEEFKNFSYSPLGISGLILNLIRDYFENNTKNFRYSTNEIESQIIIDLASQWRAEEGDNYPAIYIKRAQVGFRKEWQVMGDVYELLMKEDGLSYSFSVPVSAFYQIQILSRNYGEVEEIADEVSKFLLCFNHPIRSFFNFGRFNVTDISDVGLYREDNDIRICTITLDVYYGMIWKITKELPTLKVAQYDYT